MEKEEGSLSPRNFSPPIANANPSLSNYGYEPEKLSKEPKFRAYCDDVLHALDQFGKVKEWADLIKCLQKLIKVLNKHKQINVIPYKLTLGKRLAQCLHRELPSGVHLKALEVYDLVFTKLEPTDAAADLPIYSVGLFPLFQYASTQVKHKNLEIFEKYYFPLKHELYSSLSGLVLALLPGLEDETSEFYQIVLKLMDTLCSNTDSRIFYRAVWKCVVISPLARIPAINFLLARIPKEGDIEEFIPDRATVLKGLEVCLQDQYLLAQRAILELINLHFSLDKKIFSTSDLSRLVKATLSVIVRREMSLSRRLFSWLTGSNDDEADYFIKNGKEVTVAAIRDLFSQSDIKQSFASVTNVYKIIMALLDKEEIGSAIIDDILIYVFRSLYQTREATFSNKIMKSVNLLFDQLEPQMFWSYMENLITREFAMKHANEAIESIVLIDNVMDVLPLKDLEIQTIFLPSLLCNIVTSLKHLLDNKNSAQLLPAIQLTLKLFGKLHQNHSAEVSSSQNEIYQLEKVVRAMRKCTESYESFFLVLVRSHIIPGAEKAKGDANTVDFYAKTFDLACKLLSSLHDSCWITGNPDKDVSTNRIPDWFFAVIRCSEVDHLVLCCLAIRTFVELISQPNSPLLDLVIRTTTYAKQIAGKIWSLLEPSFAAIHYQVAELFIDLSKVCHNICSDVIVEAMIHQDLNKRVVEGYQRFALLWRLTGELGTSSNPFINTLFLMLDSLNDDQPIIRLVGRTWLGDSIIKAERILDPLLVVLLDPSTIRLNSKYQNIYDTRRVLHVWRILKVIIECDFKLFMQHVMEKMVSKDILAYNEQQAVASNNSGDPGSPPAGHSDYLFIPIYNYLDLLVVTALRFIQGKVTETFSAEFATQNAVVQTSSAEFLQYLLMKITNPKKASEIACQIQEPVLQYLAEAVSSSNLVFQVQLLGLLRAVVVLDSHGKDAYVFAEGESLRYSPMFLQTLVVGLLQPSSKNIRFYWLEFINSCLSHLESNLAVILPPLVKCICNIIQSDTDKNIYDSISAKDVFTLVRTLRLFLSYCNSESLSGSSDANSSQKLTVSASISGSTLGAPVKMLTDFMKSLPFTSDSSSRSNGGGGKTMEAEQAILNELPLIMRSLVQVWGPPISAPVKMQPLAQIDSFSRDGELHNKYSIQDQILQILEPLMTYHRVPLLEALLALWIEYSTEESLSTVQETILDMLSVVETSTPATVLPGATAILASIHLQMGQGSKRYRKSSKTIDETLAKKEASLFEMVDMYILKVPSDKLSQAWNHLLDLLRETLNSFLSTALLNCLKLLDDYIKRASLSEEKDRKTRRELQDLVQSLIDTCAVISGRTFSASMTTKSPTEILRKVSVSNGISLDVIPGETSTAISLAKSEELPDNKMQVIVLPPKPHISMQMLLLLSQVLAPMIDVVFEEKEKGDRIVTIIVGVLHNITTHIRDRSSANFPQAFASVSLIASLCNYPYNLRATRKDILELFYDNDFFLMNYDSLSQWKVVIDHLMTRDKTALTEFFGRMATQPNIFTNREQDSIRRAKDLKRLTFIIYSGNTDQYVTSLGTIQKFVEVLKAPSQSSVYIQEVFFCLRVLLLKFSSNNLRKFWPVVLTEMIRVFSDPSVTVSSDPIVLLAACKFLDLLMVIPPEEFNYYEWMFFTDYLSAPKSTFTPYVERISSQSAAIFEKQINDDAILKRPLISIKSFTEIKGHDSQGYIEAFLGQWCNYAYINSTSGKSPDLNYIHRLMEADFIEYKTNEDLMVT
eukprot:TRINITY_DN2827_c1_g1_i1.p1 TRINITY_DN2827_c1_g1~~TRINITY_DN2827_c1_g1_i1.p1  ORF type:complete len:1758 (-),score=500.34 TRINITY_DN2827_c1_g1_i1:72-5345(-)